MFKPLLMDRPLIFSLSIAVLQCSMYSVCTEYNVLCIPDKRDDCTRVGGWLRVAKYREVTLYYFHASLRNSTGINLPNSHQDKEKTS